jgi:outer membrane protein assembly factor BamB
MPPIQKIESGVEPPHFTRPHSETREKLMMREKEDQPRVPAIAWVRLVVAWLITMGVLLYAWARVFVMGRMAGRPERLWLAVLAAGLVATLLLTYRLYASFPPSGFSRKVLIWVGGPWVVANGLLVGLYAGSNVPPALVVLLFVPATFWVVWLAWMFSCRLDWVTRWGTLVVLLAALAGSVAILRIDGPTGDTHLDFAWRWTPTSAELGALQTETPASALEGVDLTRTTPADYPQFLGPERLGVVRGARLARDWDARPPRLLWRKPVGAGWGSFAVVGDFAVTQEQRGPEECVICYRVPDGVVAWVHADPADFESSMGGPGPRATPAIQGGRIYTVGATGILNCLDGATGKAIWTRNINDDNQATGLASHGVCGSPLIVDELVVVCPTGANGISLAAYRLGTGEPVWATGQDQASYASPLLATLAGTRQILLTTSEGVTGHDAATGAVLWRFPWTNNEKVNCSQPLVGVGGEDQVFISTGYGRGCALFRVERSAEDKWAATPLQNSRYMQTKFTTPIYHDGYIYGLDNRLLECLDPARLDKPLWQKGRYEYGQILLAGDVLIVQTESGPVVLVEPSPEGPRPRGRMEALSSKTWNNPALAGKYLLVRNDREAACYELPLEDGPAPSADAQRR